MNSTNAQDTALAAVWLIIMIIMIMTIIIMINDK